MNVDDMLSQGSFKSDHCSKEFQDLISLFVEYREIDFQKGVENIKKLEKLSDKWISHFERYIEKFEYSFNVRENLFKAIYLFKVFSLLASKEKVIN